MDTNELSKSILKNLEIIKKETKHDVRAENETNDDNPDELIKQIPQSNRDVGQFDYSANRTLLEETYFKNSKLLRA